ncbi:hypothetical protein FAGAP_10477 [Fusarium agapanthi]|uniref:Uncharacterized protein n=1 Tax=Fusarium agapanthi TaxID=1803897 RepID=A0A9P5B0Y2_9HYPO|nr:hypothetical protein FAGAP_10477 [Fusarium agapanthi]
MPHPRIQGFAALKKRANQLENQDVRLETEQKGITLVESMTLRGVNNEKSSGLRIINNSHGGGRQENVVAKVPGVEGTYAAIIDNAESLLDAYKMLPRGKISVIFAVPPNGSGGSMTSSEIPWSVLKAAEEQDVAATESAIHAVEAPDDDATVVGDDETVVGEDDRPKKGDVQENDETTPEPTTTITPANDPEVLYPDLAVTDILQAMNAECAHKRTQVTHPTRRVRNTIKIMFFKPIFCSLCIRRRRAGSIASNRLSEEQPINEDPEGGEPPREIELPNNDAVQPDVQQDGPQQDSEMVSFPRLEEDSDVSTPSHGISQQDSEPGSHSTARTQSSAHSDPTEENQKVGNSSDGVPQVNDTETVGDQNSTDSQRHHESQPPLSPGAIAVLEAAGERFVLDKLSVLSPSCLGDQSDDNNANAVPQSNNTPTNRVL